MIDITKAQANQTTRNGVNEDWTITLDGEELYTLPAHFTVQETFIVRGIIEDMMKRASDEMKEQEQQLCLVKLDHLMKHGDAKLNALAAENERLSEFVEQHINREVA